MVPLLARVVGTKPCRKGSAASVNGCSLFGKRPVRLYPWIVVRCTMSWNKLPEDWGRWSSMDERVEVHPSVWQVVLLALDAIMFVVTILPIGNKEEYIGRSISW